MSYQWGPPPSFKKEMSGGATASSTYGHSVTTGGSSSTKGTPVELIASSAFDATAIRILAHSYAANTVDSRGCLDILAGASTEDVLIPDLLMGHCGTWLTSGAQGCKVWEFPLFIPAGTRLSAQVAGARVSTAMRVAIELIGDCGVPFFGWCGTRVDTYGIGTVPSGTAITPGTSGAQGSWTEMSSSVSRQYHALVPSFQGASSDTSWGAKHLTVGIGIGAATEEELVSSYHFFTDSIEQVTGPINPSPHLCAIANASRIVMRASNHSTNDAYEAAIHLVA